MSDGRYTIVVNQPDYMDPGYIGEVLDTKKKQWKLVSRSNFDWKLTDSIDSVVLLGSMESPLEDNSETRRHELHFIEKILKFDVPLFAVCYGAQLLAQCLSSRVYSLEKTMFGFRHVEILDKVLPSGPQFFWHNYGFDCPKTANLLAHGELSCDAFSHKRALAVQFHPDANLNVLKTWMRAGVAELREINEEASPQLCEAAKNEKHGLNFMNSAMESLLPSSECVEAK